MDNYETEIENEGKINIPKITTIPTKFLEDKNIPIPFYRINSLQIKTKNIELDLKDCDFKLGYKLNCTTKIKTYRNSLKLEDISSYTTKLSMGSTNDKIKKVTFSTVEIIRIENFKRYNKMNTLKKNENNILSTFSNCILF